MSILDFIVHGLPTYPDSHKQYMIVKSNKEWIIVSKDIIDEELELGFIEYSGTVHIDNNETHKYRWLL